MRAPSNLQGWRWSGNPPNSLCVRRTRTPLRLGPRLGGAPARTFTSFSDTLGRKLSPIAHLAALAGVAVAVLLSGNAITWALEDCAAAYERQDYSAALQLCRPLAEQGDARAQLSLGGMYYNDQGVQQGYSEAAKWTRKAAEQGYTRRRPTSASCTGMAKGCSKTLFWRTCRSVWRQQTSRMR